MKFFIGLTVGLLTMVIIWSCKVRVGETNSIAQESSGRGPGFSKCYFRDRVGSQLETRYNRGPFLVGQGAVAGKNCPVLVIQEGTYWHVAFETSNHIIAPLSRAEESKTGTGCFYSRQTRTDDDYPVMECVIPY